MVFLPYTNLFIGPTHTIASAGSHILVLENLTGDVISRHTLEENVYSMKSGPVRCLDVDFAGRVIAAVGEDKMLKLWEMDERGILKVVNWRELPKKPTQIRFTKDGQTILVSDKFGDVFSYPLPYEPLHPDNAQQKQKDALSSHENPSNGTLVLGHASPLNCFVLTDDGRYIITADRDEHIRVSRYPKGYIIEMYCLGHSKFVSALHIPPTEPTLLISGGGDAELKVWDWLKGSLRCELKVWELVERFLIVKAVKGSSWDEEGGDGDGKIGNKKRKRKGKEKGKKEPERADEGHDEVDGSDQENGVPAASVDGCVSKPSKVLVIQQIESVLSSSTVYVLFSAVGATALFAFPFKSGVQPSEIVHFDFRRPILGFSVLENEMAVVYLDGERTDPEAETVREDRVEYVRVVGIASGQFTEHMEYRKELIESLNSKVLIPANAAELKSLDLYGALRALPKHSSDLEIEESSLHSLPIGAPELSASNYKARAKAKGQESKKVTEEVEMSKKEVGRMKGKMKVLEKAKEQGKGGEKSSKKDLVRKRGGEGGENEGEKGAKKVRTDGAGLVEDSDAVTPANSRFSPTANFNLG